MALLAKLSDLIVGFILLNILVAPLLERRLLLRLIEAISELLVIELDRASM